MKRLYNMIRCMLALLPFGMSSCDVHEFPAIPEKVPFHLVLKCDIKATQMTEMHYLYDGYDPIFQKLGDTYDNIHERGQIRYIVRAYPSADKRSSRSYTQEFVFTKEIADGYDHTVTLDLVPGDYDIMVWTDMVGHKGDTPFYDAGNFSEIILQGEHWGNNDYRDAFRGSGQISLMADIIESTPQTLEIALERPLAKYELITTDLTEFVRKEVLRNRGDVDIDEYRVEFIYSGYMPNAYNMFSDRPVDAVMGVRFDAEAKQLNEDEVSLGFDYVFVNGSEASVSVQIAVYDKHGELVSLTNSIEVPLERSHHTILRGLFLKQGVSGGIEIVPGFDGDINYPVGDME